MQRPAHALFGALAIQRISFFARARVERHHRIQLRAGLIVGLDSREVRIHESARGDLAGGHRSLQIGDRLLVDLVKTEQRHGLRTRGGLAPALGSVEGLRQGHGALAGEQDRGDEQCETSRGQAGLRTHGLLSFTLLRSL